MDRTSGKFGYSRHLSDAGGVEHNTPGASEEKHVNLAAIIPRKEGGERPRPQVLLSPYRNSPSSRQKLIDSRVADLENRELPPVPETPPNQVIALSGQPVEERSEHLSSSDDTPLIPIHSQENSEPETELLNSQDSAAPPADLNSDAPKHVESSSPANDTPSTHRVARDRLPVYTQGRRAVYSELKTSAL
jgi:hypothetical protein